MGLASFHGGHSRYGDGETDPIQIARAARENHFVAFGFTEHFDMPPETKDEDWLVARPKTWLGDYVRDVHAAREEHAGSMEVLMGVELDFIRGAEASTRGAVSSVPFDYFVGSVHSLRVDDRDICIDADVERTAEAQRLLGSPEALQLEYYDHVVELLGWDLATVIGHLDVIKKRMSPDDLEPTDAIRKAVTGVLEAIRDARAAIDLNSNGYPACGEQYPSEWILREAFRIGVPVTLGDDSHSPEMVGNGLERAIGVLRSAGYDSMWLVRGHHELERVPLPG